MVLEYSVPKSRAVFVSSLINVGRFAALRSALCYGVGGAAKKSFTVALGCCARGVTFTLM